MASSSAPPPPPSPGPGHVIPDNAIFVTDKCYCRPYLETDAEPSALLADDPAIARWMREAFPQPYTAADAQRWIATSLAESPMLNFAVVALDGTYVGGIGLKPRVDVERRTKELGYWLGRPHWGRGIATSAARGMARWAFDQFPDLLRLEAQAAAANAASCAVLAKAGFQLEGTLRQAAVKNGEIMDMNVYGLLRRDFEAGAAAS